MMETRGCIKPEIIEAPLQNERPNAYYEIKFEEFKKQMNIQLREYAEQQNEIRSELIRLRIRIQELEVDSFIKDRTIKVLRQQLEGSMSSKKDDTLFNVITDQLLNLETKTNDESVSSKIQDPVLKQLHIKVYNAFNENIHNLKVKHFKFLVYNYKIDELIQYSKLPEFNSMDKKCKRYVNFHIKNVLLKEFE